VPGLRVIGTERDFLKEGNIELIGGISFNAASTVRAFKGSRKVRRNLAREGWKVLTLWECQLKDMVRLEAKIRSFLDEER